MTNSKTHFLHQRKIILDLDSKWCVLYL